MTRQLLIDLVSAALERQTFVHAAWLEGADAAGRADAYSDIDVWADVDAGFAAQTFAVVRDALLTLGPLDVDYDPVHPHPLLEQRFYRVAGLSPFWFVDMCVQQHGRETVFPPHDPFKVLFDRNGILQTTAVTDEAFVAEAVQALERAWWRRILVLKEVKRGRLLEALGYYHHEVLEPLTRLLRLRYCPAKYDYDLKHLYADLPREVVLELEKLYTVVTLAEMPTALGHADELFQATLTEVRHLL